MFISKFDDPGDGWRGQKGVFRVPIGGGAIFFQSMARDIPF